MSNKKLNHLWIIMDWNRRWANNRLLPAIAWHKAWADNIVKITELVEKKWIKYLTLWALSTNNLINRTKNEVDWIIKLINNIEWFLEKMNNDNLRFKVIWDIEKLPIESQTVLNRVVKNTRSNTWITLIIALVYWWQDEILRATKKILEEWINPDSLTEEVFKKYLDTYDLPNPDVIVRTWWDVRHSWFLLFDSEYSEYYFTEKGWPEFDESELDNVISFYSWSKRNFGK